ncbi:unnamed protein product [Taenia asiatica]|uniref:Rho-GAP domain-containing protein n=1 Tax=Taenia asiatica TaxID=60517 RepID=A0A0R3W0P3_TAEAS|nr:unnamed protein product [Taenia asiatica]
MTFASDPTRSPREHSTNSNASDSGSRAGSPNSATAVHAFSNTEAGVEPKMRQCTSDPGTSCAEKVCQMTPMVVQILLDILETRIPPIHNLRAGLKDKTVAEIAAMTENIKRNSAVGLESAKQTLKDHSTGTLLQLLRYYLLNNYPSLFEPTHQLCKLSAIFLHVPYIPSDDKQHYAIGEVTKACEKMTTRRIMLLSLIMRRLHLWVQNQIAFEITNNPSIGAEEIAYDAYSLLADIFADCLIRVPARTQMSLLENGINVEEVESVLSAHAVEEPENSSEEESEDVSDESIHSATQYLKKEKSRAHYKRLAMNIKLAKENAKREADKAKAKMTQKPMPSSNDHPNRNDFRAKSETQLRPGVVIIQEPVEVQETQMMPKNECPGNSPHSQPPCEGTLIRIVDTAGNECDRICLNKEISWSVLMLMISAIKIDFWHKMALNVLTTKQYREKMRRSKGGTWRKLADLALLRMKK